MVKGFPVPQPYISLNESPSEKEGKSTYLPLIPAVFALPSMKVPPKRKGNVRVFFLFVNDLFLPSMKVPPKRKGNHPA